MDQLAQSYGILDPAYHRLLRWERRQMEAKRHERATEFAGLEMSRAEVGPDWHLPSIILPFCHSPTDDWCLSVKRRQHKRDRAEDRRDQGQNRGWDREERWARPARDMRRGSPSYNDFSDNDDSDHYGGRRQRRRHDEDDLGQIEHKQLISISATVEWQVF